MSKRPFEDDCEKAGGRDGPGKRPRKAEAVEAESKGEAAGKSEAEAKVGEVIRERLRLLGEETREHLKDVTVLRDLATIRVESAKSELERSEEGLREAEKNLKSAKEAFKPDEIYWLQIAAKLHTHGLALLAEDDGGPRCPPPNDIIKLFPPSKVGFRSVLLHVFQMGETTSHGRNSGETDWDDPGPWNVNGYESINGIAVADLFVPTEREMMSVCEPGDEHDHGSYRKCRCLSAVVTLLAADCTKLLKPSDPSSESAEDYDRDLYKIYPAAAKELTSTKRGIWSPLASTVRDK